MLAGGVLAIPSLEMNDAPESCFRAFAELPRTVISLDVDSVVAAGTEVLLWNRAKAGAIGRIGRFRGEWRTGTPSEDLPVFLEDEINSHFPVFGSVAKSAQRVFVRSRKMFVERFLWRVFWPRRLLLRAGCVYLMPPSGFGEVLVR